jgi:hypothetical protein
MRRRSKRERGWKQVAPRADAWQNKQKVPLRTDLFSEPFKQNE